MQLHKGQDKRRKRVAKKEKKHNIYPVDTNFRNVKRKKVEGSQPRNKDMSRNIHCLVISLNNVACLSLWNPTPHLMVILYYG